MPTVKDIIAAYEGTERHNDRTGVFREKCDARGIEYQNKLTF